MRVAVIGYGNIGRTVVEGIRSGAVPGATLAGVVVRRPGSADGVHELSLSEALAASDVVVEAAGVPAAREMSVQVLEAGVDLLMVSMGVLADPKFRASLLEAGPGRLFLSTGAIAGLDLLAAAAGAGGLSSASLTSTKKPVALVQPWMSDDEAAALREASEPVVVFEGSVQEAIERFPKSVNIGVALAAATGLWADARVRLVADPAADLTVHRVEASGSLGNYDFQIVNKPSPGNPASSAIVGQALLQGLRTIGGVGLRFV